MTSRNQSNNCAPRLPARTLYQSLKQGTADDFSQPKIRTGSARIRHPMSQLGQTRSSNDVSVTSGLPSIATE